MAAVTGTTPIVALDFPDARTALALVERLGESCRFYKIGSQLFTVEGPRVVEAVLERGNRVFLDLKFHDIPNTVLGAARSAAGLGVSLLTVHAIGGSAMVSRAAEGVAGTGARVLGVTILTSMAGEDLARAWGRQQVSITDEAVRLGKLALGAGAHGLVCAGAEVSMMRAVLGGGVELLVPGVRLAGDDAGDQARVVTPKAAADAGATYIVLGRTVTGAADPAAAMRRVLAELEARVG